MKINVSTVNWKRGEKEKRNQQAGIFNLRTGSLPKEMIGMMLILAVVG
jgi:hypothetical protein